MRQWCNSSCIKKKYFKAKLCSLDEKTQTIFFKAGKIFEEKRPTIFGFIFQKNNRSKKKNTIVDDHFRKFALRASLGAPSQHPPYGRVEGLLFQILGNEIKN
jgi:hypothetical protein